MTDPAMSRFEVLIRWGCFVSSLSVFGAVALSLLDEFRFYQEIVAGIVIVDPPRDFGYLLNHIFPTIVLAAIAALAAWAAIKPLNVRRFYWVVAGATIASITWATANWLWLKACLRKNRNADIAMGLDPDRIYCCDDRCAIHPFSDWGIWDPGALSLLLFLVTAGTLAVHRCLRIIGIAKKR